MKADCKFITNLEEIEKCESMGIDWKPTTDNYPLLFDLNDVKAAYLDKEGDIIIYLGGLLDEDQWRLNYTKELWKQLIEKFK